MPSATIPEPRRGRCPGCGRPETPGHAPFCSQGCRDRDLLAWLSDDRRIPGSPADPDDDFAPDGLDSRADPSL